MRNDSHTVPDSLESLGLTPAQTTLYTALLRLHRASLAELAEAVDRPEEPLGHQLAALVRLGVVDQQSGEYFARHPAGALGRLIAERLDRLAEESRRIDSALGSIRTLMRDYDAGHDYRRGPFPVELVSGADELYESVVGMAVNAPPLELLTAIPDQRTVADFARKYADQWIDAHRHGLLSLRALLPVGSLTVSGLREKLRMLTEAGARVRTLDRVPSWFFTAGQDAAGLPAQWGGNLPENAYNYYYVRAPIVVGVLRSLFGELWARAEPLPWAEAADGAIQVLRLAAQGLPDETIARHLGVSVRTVRARFAEAMADLGAQSRFHAGVEAARRGWLDDGKP
ncbi:DNA-binding CsgD family transcriptional regulator [Thermocatellispora tengchongensis]|uniref:DNA-binding CsgD family transcriptional regulator n=1 Tax=Thermocatellispora tengchongensis TaxID=1073253 RepID=A0A840PNU6_9ACTN|nr:LuxR family transcriptional regulator [Thermocatellispora tengchongensis]MBB5139380.1 DNA-binding CsgD family transcriptional regulator [Thermocatellispora tengchongensis]